MDVWISHKCCVCLLKTYDVLDRYYKWNFDLLVGIRAFGHFCLLHCLRKQMGQDPIYVVVWLGI